MKIIFCGYARAGKECLIQLLQHPKVRKENIFVYTCEGPENGIFEDYLKKMQFSYKLTHINKDYKFLKSFNPNFLFSVYYRFIISDEILSLTGFKSMNLHPSLLPDYRGCFSSVWAILNGEEKTGITFHYISSEIDGGNILLQKEIKLKESDTAFSLYNKLIELFVEHFLEATNLLIKGNKGSIQTKTKDVKYYKRELPFNGVLKANEIEFSFAKKFFRALYFPPFPNAKFIIDGNIIEINSLEMLNNLKDKFKI